MTNRSQHTRSTFAVLLLADIKSATAAFDRGERNVFEVLDAIGVAVEAYHAAVRARRDAA